jgi:hypothetical protein
MKRRQIDFENKRNEVETAAATRARRGRQVGGVGEPDEKKLRKER